MYIGKRREMLEKKSFLVCLLVCSMFVIQEAGAQNYWGDSHIQPLQKNPNVFKPKQMASPLPKKVVELPDVPDIKDDAQYKVVPPVKTSKNPSPVLELGAKSEKIPVGTKLKIVFNSNLNAKKSREGDPFSATIKDDIYVDGNLIMPAGTLIRGRVGKVKKPRLFSRSGSMVLNFDHIVTPLGSELNLDLDLSNKNNIDKKGALVANQGLGEAIKDSAASGYNTAKTITKAGYNAGMAAGKVPVVATTPAAAAVGTLAGSSVFVTKSALAIFKKGGNPVITSGDQLEIMFSEDMDIPVN